MAMTMTTILPTPSAELPTPDDYLFLMDALRSEKVVRFAPMVLSAPANPLAFEELKEFWYSPRELMQFKQQAREARDERGMEYATPQRQKHRLMTIRCTLSAARHGLSEENLRQVVRKCTQWSGELAFVQACHDFAIAYNPQLLSALPSLMISPPEFPFAVIKRRNSCGSESSSSSSNSNSSNSGSSTNSRRVRQRRVL